MSDNFLYSDGTLADLTDPVVNDSIEAYFEEENKLYTMFKEAGFKRYYSGLLEEDRKLAKKVLADVVKRSSDIFFNEVYCVRRSKGKSKTLSGSDNLHCYLDLGDVQLPFVLTSENPFSKENKVFIALEALAKEDDYLSLTGTFNLKPVYNLLLKDYEECIKLIRQRNLKTKLKNIGKTNLRMERLKVRQKELRALKELIKEK